MSWRSWWLPSLAPHVGAGVLSAGTGRSDLAGAEVVGADRGVASGRVVGDCVFGQEDQRRGVGGRNRQLVAALVGDTAHVLDDGDLSIDVVLLRGPGKLVG